MSESGSSAWFVHIGFGGLVAIQRALAVLPPESAPVRRIIQEAKREGKAIDATYGRKTKAVIVLDTGHVVLAALHPATILGRVRQQGEVAE